MILSRILNTLSHSRGIIPSLLKPIKLYTPHSPSLPLYFSTQKSLLISYSANFSTDATTKPKRARKLKVDTETKPLEDAKATTESPIETKPKRVRKPKVSIDSTSTNANESEVVSKPKRGRKPKSSTETESPKSKIEKGSESKPKRGRKPKVEGKTEPKNGVVEDKPKRTRKLKANTETEPTLQKLENTNESEVVPKPKRGRKPKTSTETEPNTQQVVIDTLTGSIFSNLENLTITPENNTITNADTNTNDPLLTTHDTEKSEDSTGFDAATSIDSIVSELNIPTNSFASGDPVRLSIDFNADLSNNTQPQLEEEYIEQVGNFKFCPKDQLIVALCEELGIPDVSNVPLFAEALTVSTKFSPVGSKDIGRLAYLGESTLEYFIFEIIQKELPNMKHLQKVITSPPALFDLSMAMGIGPTVWVDLPHYLGSSRMKIVSEALKAFIGAVYLEYGEDDARTFIRENVLFRADETLLKNFYYIYFNHKNLTLALENLRLSPITPFQLKEPLKRGNDNELIFAVKLYQKDKGVATGEGRRLGDAIYNARETYFNVLQKQKGGIK
eukprot:TRINITY_DN3039_c0_g1_i1.p1 TRINITY_DN3039_c0_g1~~TRINITY_DN3039_c0_g1_i1.p1  ORF type:complete len:559 (-),score=121.43 TRINITY_DN3039_c0_g1_i1:39-1715(-)